MSRSLLRSVLELRTPITRLPPTFLLPIRARSLSTTTATHDAGPAVPPTATPTQTAVPPIASFAAPAPTLSPPSPTPQAPTQTQTPTTTPTPTTITPDSIAHLFPLLRAQPAHYITVHIHGQPYLVTQGDRVRLPFLMHGVVPGDVLRLDRASVLGSRDYTLLGSPHVDGALFECRATVLGVDSEPMRVKVKTKRRNRRARRVYSKHKFTVLRISELKLLGPPAATATTTAVAA
ncbi:hypothetical protein GGR54DRAFT_228798 [Hypoxylon sp. NC1633]|nr:hypothetical protein GGR54DRAFT_228798 [Hypoxylon sp. NC1633]